MKIAYLLMIHNTPNHTYRLINKLNTKNSFFYIHLDKKSNMNEYGKIEGENIFFTKERVDVRWGEYSQVQAILQLLRSAASHENFDRYVLLSGADYPIANADEIERFFIENAEFEFINCVKMGRESKPLSRVTLYKPPRPRNKIQSIIQHFLKKIGYYPKSRDYKRYLGDLIPYAGSTWWAISSEACSLILEFDDKNPAISNFFVNTDCPDESYFHTILANSHLFSKFKRNLTYTDWSAGGASPAYMNINHIMALKENPFFDGSDKLYGSGRILFARKFRDNSDELLKELDA